MKGDDDDDEDGRVYISPVAKWLISGVFVVTLGWLSWTSLSIIQLKEDFYTQNRDLQTIITRVASDVQWMKNEAQQGERFTSRDAEAHDTRLRNLENRTERFIERVIRLETTSEIVNGNGNGKRNGGHN